MSNALRSVDAQRAPSYVSYDVMTKRINARLDPELYAKVETLRRMTNQSTTDVLKAAIELYHNAVSGRVGTPQGVLERTGFIGCAEGPRDLSSKYKGYLAESLSKKS